MTRTAYADRLDLAVDCARGAGQILKGHFAQGVAAVPKENHSSVVTVADLDAERHILEQIRSRFPEDGIIAEESGMQPGRTDLVWVVDPLDGTSNFAAGVPWFGVLIAVLKSGVPVAGVMHLPTSDTLYVSEMGGGVWRNGAQVRVTAEPELRNVLCAYNLDPSPDPAKTRREAEAMARLVTRVRNVRSTNSLVDFCYTVDGRLGGCVTQGGKIWDFAAAALMFREAGGRFTDLSGAELEFDLGAGTWDRLYSAVGASPALLPQILAVLTL
ncbi:MAG: inositol monophosphatase [Verrucomicrobia bacterium]|nr:inositol monophosphatase [Verrucomicrobiota bacterium]